MSHPNAVLIHEFYDAFNRHDADAMGEAYHDDAVFSDPVFTKLDADGVRAMWSMLTSGGGDLRVELVRAEADDERGSARWEAWYTFTPTGRKVHNVIDAEFEFRDGKIMKHTDTFDFYRWSRQALGAVGLLLGWTPFVQNKVRRTAGRQLERFRAESG